MKTDWRSQDGDCTRKTPTSLLLKPDLSFDSFGYAAEEKYSNLRSVFEEKEYWFFQHFKMCLHNDEVRAYEINTPLKTERTTPKKNKQTKEKRKQIQRPNYIIVHIRYS